MCGIAGISWKDRKIIEQMTHVLAHRGPDSQGVWVDERVSLGHTRLKIVDLSSKGSQPMKYKHWTIVFNGEIYNFPELRQQLQKLGHKFRSQTDTEVILHAYAQWGAKAVTKFQGMWALGIYDSSKREFFLSRDRFGIKPLFYTHQGKEFVFASEVKTVLETGVFQLDYWSLNAYFFHRYIPQPQTIYAQIKALPAGYNATYDLDSGRLRLNRYYDLKKHIAQAKTLDGEDRVTQLSNLIPQVVQDHLIADVPIGAFLSGGLDSSLITALACRTHPEIKTFSISFPRADYDESQFSTLVANKLNLEHQVEEFWLTEEFLERTLMGLGQPMGDASILPTAALSIVAKKKVAVALSGDGADEIFGGYDTYRAALVSQYLPGSLMQLMQPLNRLISDNSAKVSKLFLLKRFLERYHSRPHWHHLLNTAVFPQYQRLELLQKQLITDQWLLASLDSISEPIEQQLDMDTYLPSDILIKTDLASMQSGLEVRVPFLDHRIVPLALSLPQSQRYSVFTGKIWLKQFASEYLPHKIVHRRKRGFTVPLHSLFIQSPLLQELILSKTYYQHLLVDYDYVQQLYQQTAVNGRYTREVWLVAVFNFWWHRWKRKVELG